MSISLVLTVRWSEGSRNSVFLVSVEMAEDRFAGAERLLPGLGIAGGGPATVGDCSVWDCVSVYLLPERLVPELFDLEDSPTVERGVGE